MKKNLTLIIAFVCTMCMQAQEHAANIDNITIHAYVPESEALPSEFHKLLETKLDQIIAANGIADDENSTRFILTAKINATSKNIVAGPSPRVTQKLDVTLILGDVEEDKMYAQLTFPVLGIGQSVESSYIAAFKNINPQDPAITEFMQEGKEKAMAYYQVRCKNLITEATKLAAMQKYEDAINLLSSIPDICPDCFNEAVRMSAFFHHDLIEAQGADLLKQARSAWTKAPTKEGADEAIRLLSQINFAASCQPQAETLMGEIIQKMSEIEGKEWEHKMQMYKDGLEREKRQWELQVKESEERAKWQREQQAQAREKREQRKKEKQSTQKRVPATTEVSETNP